MIQLSNKQYSTPGKAFLYIIGFYSIFTLFTLLKNSYSYSSFSISKNILNINLENYLINYILVLAFIFIILSCCKTMFKRNLSWLKSAFIHLILAFLFGTYLYLGTTFFKYSLDSAYPFSFPSFTDYFINTIDHNFLIYFSFIAIIYTLLYFEKAKQTEDTSALLSNNLENSKLETLQSQIHPSFLFNGLNTISSLMKTNVQLAQNTTVNLSEYLRETLIYKDQKFISVKNDLQLINRYIDIIRSRYHDQLNVNIQVHENVKTCYIPTMLIQPIIENFIKNGIKYCDAEILNIKISLINIDKKTNITIESDCNENKKFQFAKQPLEEGILNLEKRLQLIFPEEYSLSIKNMESKQGYKAKIIFPCKSKKEIEKNLTI